MPDNDPQAASPRGIAIRFYLAEHVHTDIVAHSFDGFPTRSGEEFLEFARAVAASGPDAAKPTPIEGFLLSHPKAMQFATASKPIPTSFARESFFAVSAMRFTNETGTSRYGRFRIRPEAGSEYLTDAEAAKKSPTFLFDELAQRLAAGPVKYRIMVQLAADGDETADATVAWPADRQEIEFGTVTLTKRVNELDPELRKIIFDPIPRVDGIDPSADPLFEVRSAIYLLSGRRRRAASAPSQSKWTSANADYPPATAPTTRNGSAPLATASGSGASGDSSDQSSWQAKNRKNARRSCVTWSRIVPFSIG